MPGTNKCGGLLNSWKAMKLLRYLPGLLCALLAAPALAQTDTILRTNGEEVRGRVLTISPVELSYLPSAGPVGQALLLDTLRLPVASVFLVRYANGTRDLLQPLAPAAASAAPENGPFRDQTAYQRLQRGKADALTQYRGDSFGGALGATILLGPLVGIAPTVAIGSTPVKPHNLNAAAPALLLDPSYAAGYRQEAGRLKRRRAWAGYGTGVGIYALLIGIAVAAVSQ